MASFRSFILLLTPIVLVCAVEKAGASPDRQHVASAIAKARGAIRGQDFANALKHLDSVSDAGDRASEVKELQAICHLGNALIADKRADEDRAVIPLASSLRTFVQRNAGRRPDDQFLRDIQPHVDQYLSQVDERSAQWQKVFVASLREARVARQVVVSAVGEITEPSPRRDRLVALGLWSRLYEILMLREASGTVDKLVGVLAPAELDEVRKDLPSKQAIETAEFDLRRAVLNAIKLAQSEHNSELSEAVAECLMMYCAADGRLRSGQFLLTLTKYTSLPHADPAPSPLAEEQPKGPGKSGGEILSDKQLSTTLLGSPESLLLPLFRSACADGKKDTVAKYELLLAMLRTSEAEAGKLVKGRSVEVRTDSAFALEQARFAAREERDVPGAMSQVLIALRNGRLTRHCFGSVAPELHLLWVQSRRVCDLADAFFLTYAPLFRLIDMQTSGADRQRAQATELYSVRLRLAEHLATSNYPPDVALGISEGFRTLGRIRSLPLTDEQAAQVELYRRSIETRAASMRIIPVGLVVTRQGIRPLSSVSTQHSSQKPPYIFVSPKGGGLYVPQPAANPLQR
jgi:hypothetical protein